MIYNEQEKSINGDVKMEETKITKIDSLRKELRKSKNGKLTEQGLKDLCELMDINDPDELKFMKLINENKPPEEILEILGRVINDDS